VFIGRGRLSRRGDDQQEKSLLFPPHPKEKCCFVAPAQHESGDEWGNALLQVAANPASRFATREKRKESEQFSLTLQVMAASKGAKRFAFEPRHPPYFPDPAD
jgi:hypothetical protein